MRKQVCHRDGANCNTGRLVTRNKTPTQLICDLILHQRNYNGLRIVILTATERMNMLGVVLRIDFFFAGLNVERK